jgi:hypothetical protein
MCHSVVGDVSVIRFTVQQVDQHFLCTGDWRGSTRDTYLYWFRYKVPYVQLRMLFYTPYTQVTGALMEFVEDCHTMGDMYVD